MRIAVIGAAGRTGREVLEQALARGDDVTALARRPEHIGVEHARLTTVAADALDRAAVVGHLAGADAVVSTLGVGTSRAPTTVYSEGAANVLAAMHVHAIGRLAVISAAPAGPRQAQPFLERRVLIPVLDRIFGTTYTDMRRMEALLQASDVEWVALRPPRLVGRAPTGRYRVGAPRPPAKARTLTYADLATALLDVLDRGDLQRRAVFVAN